MKRYGDNLALFLGAFVLVETLSCQRETPAEKTGSRSSPAPASTEQASQPTVDGIVKTPLDKAREVENTLEKSAEHTADIVKKATQ